MIDAQQVVACHRLNDMSLLPREDWTLAAVVEQIVWQGHSSQRLPADSQWWSLFSSSKWPAPDAISASLGECVAVILPPSYDVVALRNAERDVRARLSGAGFGAQMAKALSGAVAEIVTNVWDHAQTTTPALFAYACSKERFTVSIADVGIGVLNSLRTNPQYSRLGSSLQALREATEVGVSRHPESGRGHGFHEVLRAVADQGMVRLRSGQGVLEFKGNSQIRNALGSYGVDLPGLQVSFCCGSTSSVGQVL